MTKAMYPGSFDPITNGHLDIIKRASKIYDEVIVAIMENVAKKATFSAIERRSLIESCIKDMPNVRVIIGEGLTIKLAKKEGCSIIIRGIRAVADYEYELSLATTNMKLDDEIETVFLVARPEFSFMSSSIAKEIAHYDGDISGLIPEIIKDDVLDRLK